MLPRLRTVACFAFAILSGCATTTGPEAPGFGPAPDDIEHELDQQTRSPKVPPNYERATAVAASKSLPVRRTRIDVGDAQVQNWEVEIDIARADPVSADGDEVFAAWMTGRPGTDGRTATELRAVRSVDGARSFSTIDLTIPAAARPIPFDPTIEYDRIERKAYIAAMGQGAVIFEHTIWIATSRGSNTAAFAPGVTIPSTTSPDKGWLAAGPAPGNANAGVLYFAERNGVRSSLDHGATWSAPVQLPRQNSLLQPLVFPDGALGVTYYGGGDQALFARSTDRGRSFSNPAPIHTFVGSLAELTGGALPGSFRAPPVTMFARSPVDGRLYAVLSDITRRDGTEADVDVLLFESADQGTTWSAGRVVAADAPAFSDQFMPWLAIDAAGRLHLAYFDTRRHTGNDASVNAPVDVWHAVSTDRGVTWNSTRLTEQPIESQSTRWSPISNAANAQFLGDYLTLAVSAHAVYVAHPVSEAGVIGMAVSRIDFSELGAGTIRDPRGLAGPWFEPATSGQGFEFHWLTGDRLLVFFYGHHDNGTNFFLVGTRDGRFGYGETIDVPMVIVSGGRYNSFNPSAIHNTPWGTVRLRFDSCDAASARLDGIDGIQNLSIERLAVAPNLPCD